MLARNRAYNMMLPAIVLFAGCIPFGNSPSMGGNDQDLDLPQLQASKETIQVEILYAERPYHDLLIGDVLWDAVDESGALDPSQRQAVNANGFRVGIVASDPPESLQRLLGLTTDQNSRTGTNQTGLNGRRVGLFQEASTEIQTSDIWERCSIEVTDAEEQVHVLDFENARCVMRLKADSFQPGWARIELQPEIHYGQNRLRRHAAEEGWQLKTSQEIKPLFGLNFEVVLNQGEMVVVGDLGHGPETAGNHFFVTGEGPERRRRLLVIRLADMQTTVGRRSE